MSADTNPNPYHSDHPDLIHANQHAAAAEDYLWRTDKERKAFGDRDNSLATLAAAHASLAIFYQNSAVRSGRTR